MDIDENKEEFNRIHQKIKVKIVKEDIEREKYLEKRREDLAAMMSRKQMHKASKKVKPAPMKN